MNRSGIRVGDLCFGDFEVRFVQRFRRLVADYTDGFDKLKVDVEAEVERYRQLAETIRPFVTETVSYLHNQVLLSFSSLSLTVAR
jgi:adenylosuccinate synthase